MERYIGLWFTAPLRLLLPDDLTKKAKKKLTKHAICPVQYVARVTPREYSNSDRPRDRKKTTKQETPAEWYNHHRIDVHTYTSSFLPSHPIPSSTFFLLATQDVECAAGAGACGWFHERYEGSPSLRGFQRKKDRIK